MVAMLAEQMVVRWVVRWVVQKAAVSVDSWVERKVGRLVAV